MKTLTSVTAIFLVSLFTSPATAGPATEALSTCLADSTTGKDRKELAQWIFVAMAAHPDIKPLSAVSAATREELDKNFARLATKLLTDSCSKQAKLAIASEGNASFEASFNVLGKLAMQELTSNPSVSASFSNYTKYLDRSKIDTIFSTK